MTSQNLLTLITIGTVFTAVVQSSSVTTGLVVILAQGKIISLHNAVPIIIGANIGTTITAIIASLKMETNAKRTACAHVLFNVGGVIIFVPFIPYITKSLSYTSEAVALANLHFLFNTGTSLLFLIFLGPFTNFITKFIKPSHQLSLPTIEFPKVDIHLTYEETQIFLNKSFSILLGFLKENYKLTNISLEKNVKGILSELQNRSNYFDYLQSDFVIFFSNIVNNFTKEDDIYSALESLGRYEYLYQIQDSLNDILKIKEHMDLMYIELGSDMLKHLRNLANKTTNIFEILENFKLIEISTEQFINENLNQLQKDLILLHRDVLRAMSDESRKDAGVMLHILTYSQRIKDKLYNLSKKLII